MNREKVAWSVSVILLVLLTLQMPRGMAQRDNDYAFVRTLVDIHRQVANNYVDGVEESKLETGAIDGMLGQLDPFTAYVPPAKQKDFDHLVRGSFEGVGIQLHQTDDGKVEVITPIDDSPAYKAGVQAGDLVLKVNGQSVENLKLDEVTEKIKGEVGTPVTLGVRHVTGVEADLTMIRQEVVVPTVRGFIRRQDGSWNYWVSEDPRIAYVRLTQFTANSHETLKGVLTRLMEQKMEGLIFDLRWNPGGQLDEAENIVNLFIDHGTIVSTKGLNRPERVKLASPDLALPAAGQVPMIVLVNEHSASASEIVAGSLEDNRRAVIVGTRSYGKGSVQELIPLEGNNGELKLTVAYYYLPSGRLVHKKKDAKDWGVVPEIEVKMDEKAERAVLQERDVKEQFRRPIVPSARLPAPAVAPATARAAATAPGATRPAAGPPAIPATAQATTQAASQPAGEVVDTQLRTATEVLTGLILYAQEHPGTPLTDLPAVAEKMRPAVTPATQPATAPVARELPLHPATNPSRPTGPSATQPNTMPSGKGGRREGED